jgi:hypothetical protein
VCSSSPALSSNDTKPEANIVTFRIARLFEEINHLIGEKGVKKRTSPRDEPGVGDELE